MGPAGEMLADPPSSPTALIMTANAESSTKGSMEAQRESAAHVLVFPFPIQGNVNSMLKLAELLSLAGLHVTFLNTDGNHRRLRSFSGSYARLDRRPGFYFRSIPDGLPEDHPRSGGSLLFDLIGSLRARSMASFRELLITGWPPVTCAVVDGLMNFAVEAAEAAGIPTVDFRSISACYFWAYACIPNLIQNGEIPLPEGANMDEPIQNIPGMEHILRRRDLPSFLRQVKDITDPNFQFLADSTSDASRARGLIFNTPEFLEGSLLARIKTHCPITYALGPLHALLTTYAFTSGVEAGFDISANLMQVDLSCMAWLDSQPDQSVVYVSFGSLTVISSEELSEFWHGLVDSGQRFLWVVRPDLVSDHESVSLPLDDVATATKERGCIVGWAPQGEVLAHRSVGCFLTHSGWNSTLESVVAGVPMICWPFFADQPINSRFVSEVWRVGLDMKDTCKRDMVERMVRDAMEGEKSNELRRSAREMAEMAQRSVEEGGSSYNDFRRLVEDIKSLSSLKS